MPKGKKSLAHKSKNENKQTSESTVQTTTKHKRNLTHFKDSACELGTHWRTADCIPSNRCIYVRWRHFGDKINVKFLRIIDKIDRYDAFRYASILSFFSVNLKLSNNLTDLHSVMCVTLTHVN